MSALGDRLVGNCDGCRSRAGLIQTVDGEFLCRDCYNAKQRKRCKELGLDAGEGQ